MTYSTRGCHLISHIRGCNLLPGCFGCALNTQTHLYSNYFSKSYLLEDRQYAYKDIGQVHYFTCVERTEVELSETCEEVAEETQREGWVLQHINFLNSLENSYLYIVYVLMAVMAVMVAIDFKNMLKMRRFEEELWQLYLHDYAEYRTIMTTFQEEEVVQEE